MTAENEQPEPQSDVPDPEPALTRSDRLFVRLTLWQTVLSVAGVFIAVVALYAALTESEAVRQQTAAAVWPFVQLTISDSDTGDAASFSISLTNVGVGPARMRTVRLEVGGEPMRNWEHVITRLGGTLSPAVSRTYSSNRVLSPGERVQMVGTTDTDLARRLMATVADPGTSISYCYCSIFDDCWLTDSTKDLQTPEPVEQCPDYGAEAFDN